jgi:uncharacterized membrane protein YfcA
MTPILLLVFGVAPVIAVGTDLWFAAVTKTVVSGLHVRQGLIDWPIVRRLWAGSLPASALTIVWMNGRDIDRATIEPVQTAIAIAVCLTGIGLVAERLLKRRSALASPFQSATAEAAATVITGAILGGLVTLTSIGAGAIGVVVLASLYPARLTPHRLVATDVAHAIPLALCAGVGHLAISQVDIPLLGNLLAGSIPAALLGALFSSRVSHAVLRSALGVVLLAVGVVMLLGIRG